MSLPRGEEITAAIRAHWLLLASQLPSRQQRTLSGPRDEAQRLIDLQLVLDSALVYGRDRFQQRGDRGVIVVGEDGTSFWFLAFAEIDVALPGLPRDARETLDMVRQVYSPADEVVVLLLLSERRMRFLYLARDGMRGQVYQRATVKEPARPTAPPRAAAPAARAPVAAGASSRDRTRGARQAAPVANPEPGAARPELIGQATETATGYLIRVRHPEWGVLGQLTLTQIDPEHMLVEAMVVGHEDDPTTTVRKAFLEPVVEALKRGFAAVKLSRAAAQAQIAAVLTGGIVPPDVPRQIATQALPCPRCDQPAFFLIFAEHDELTLDDYSRMLFEPMRGYGVPAWVVRGGPEGFGLTEARQIYPTRGEVVMITGDDLNDMIEAVFAAHSCQR